MLPRYLRSETSDVGERLQPWVDALSTIDLKNRGNKTKLIRLLASETPIPPLARLYLADLLSRKQLRIVALYSLPETSAVSLELMPGSTLCGPSTGRTNLSSPVC
jgi:hypothetical protein